MSDTKLPDEVVRLLNDPAAGGEQAIQPLFTVDDQGFPHATLSFAPQWWTGDRRLVCVLTAGRTSSYLSQRPQALLLVVGARQAYSVRLRSIKIEEVEDRRVAVVFDVTAVESDTRGVALTPALFQATGELARQEQISDRGAAAAAQLARQPGPPPQETLPSLETAICYRPLARPAAERSTRKGPSVITADVGITECAYRSL
jgi:hypothetical protein